MILGLSACTNYQKGKDSADSDSLGEFVCPCCVAETIVAEEPLTAEVESSDKPRKICVYRYEDFPVEKAMKLCKELKKYFPDVELMNERLSLPGEAFVKGRNRYRGTVLLDDLKKHQKENTVVGLTSKIICTTNEISPDFGVMGISYKNTGLCVASSIIPKNGKVQTDSNFIKLTLHELGHAYGLPHCPDQKCYMVDAEHRMKLPQTTGFCDDCRRYLEKVGNLQ